jgi:2-phospho-L-lactate guanylyltransferase
MSGARVEPQRFGVLVPLKPTVSGKSRLGSLGEDVRRELVAAFAEDTVSAVWACPRVHSVLVVTDDAAVAQQMRSMDVDAIPDGANTLNASLVQAAAELTRRSPALRPVAVCGDLPALLPHELTSVLDEVPTDAAAFVSDADGAGTTLYTAPATHHFRPRFGVDSRAAHLADDAVELAVGRMPTVHLDVDTPDDLLAAMRLGVGRRTTRVVTRLDLAALPRT